ncbi:MAG: tRNA preQ1(34) S-adenosylmethionine ribosyltransferase-isomerase QueA [Myxococcota bacterium]
MIFEDNSTQSADDLDLVDAYDYELPDELVAAHPADQRTDSRLMVAHRDTRDLEHCRFSDIAEYLRAGDVLVFNNTRVIPARLHARKETGGAVELLVLDVLEPTGSGRWHERASGTLKMRCMTRSSRPLRPGMPLELDDYPDAPEITVLAWEAGRADVELAWEQTPAALFEAYGEMPLPPYILKRRAEIGEPGHAGAADLERYQTVYASQPGAVAAPTAGLHFTDELLEDLAQKGVEQAFVTLRVGPGTFKPVSAERLSEHEMHSEEYEISPALSEAVLRARRDGRRIVAVGTTSTRALEAEARRDTPFEPGSRTTDLFLTPGSDFRVVDALITNFHLPKSTLLALVAGFAGYDFMRDIYRTAVEQEYRFYSYGDSMFIL